MDMRYCKAVMCRPGLCRCSGALQCCGSAIMLHHPCPWAGLPSYCDIPAPCVTPATTLFLCRPSSPSSATRPRRRSRPPSATLLLPRAPSPRWEAASSCCSALPPHLLCSPSSPPLCAPLPPPSPLHPGGRLPQRARQQARGHRLLRARHGLRRQPREGARRQRSG